MSDPSDRLWGVLARAERGDPLSAEDLSFAETQLYSPELRSQAHACTILLRSSRSKTVRARAIAVMERLCVQSGDEDYVTRLLLTIGYLSSSTLRSRSAFRELVERSMTSHKNAIRMNAPFALRWLAESGIPEAVEWLRTLTVDRNSGVRRNASIVLKKLGF